MSHSPAALRGDDVQKSSCTAVASPLAEPRGALLTPRALPRVAPCRHRPALLAPVGGHERLGCLPPETTSTNCRRGTRCKPPHRRSARRGLDPLWHGRPSAGDSRNAFHDTAMSSGRPHHGAELRKIDQPVAVRIHLADHPPDLPGGRGAALVTPAQGLAEVGARNLSVAIKVEGMEGGAAHLWLVVDPLVARRRQELSVVQGA
mmetsp:Transcript_128484/g.371798  ORF Transcript_128484/g.371798 Transcript_128484/m.371798 type:complete len:204 (-) Transcript_128484:1411-2022(-)